MKIIIISKYAPLSQALDQLYHYRESIIRYISVEKVHMDIKNISMLRQITTLFVFNPDHERKFGLKILEIRHKAKEIRRKMQNNKNMFLNYRVTT